MEYIRLDLKVCEICGALWLRKASQGEPYCTGCRKALIGFPKRQLRSGPRARPCREPQLRLVRSAGEVGR